MTPEEAAKQLGYLDVSHLESQDLSDHSKWWELIKQLTEVKNNVVLDSVRHCDTSKLSELFCDNKEQFKCECVGHCGNYA